MFGSGWMGIPREQCLELGGWGIPCEQCLEEVGWVFLVNSVWKRFDGYSL